MTYQPNRVIKSKAVGSIEKSWWGGQRVPTPWEAQHAHGPDCAFPFLCDQPIRSASFLKGGYVELPPKSLSPESELLATFATMNSSGIILAALGKRGENQQAHGVSNSNASEPRVQEGNEFGKNWMENRLVVNMNCLWACIFSTSDYGWMSFPYESGISLCCTIYVPCLATEKKNTCCLLLILLRLIQVAHSEFSSTYHGCYSSFSKAKTARAQIL